MKRQFLSLLFAALGVSSLFAYDVGDYVYTRNGRFRVTGANMVPNGDFSAGLSEWTTVNGSELSTDTFSVESEGGPDGKPWLKVLLASGKQTEANMGNSANLMFSVPRNENQMYVITYKVRGTSVKSTSGNTGGASNFQDVYGDEGGSSVPASKENISLQVTYADQWLEVAYDYTSLTQGFLNILFYNLLLDHGFADFGIYPVEQVGDDRLLTDAMTQVRFYADRPEEFPNNREILDMIVETLNGAVGTDIGAAEINDMLDQFIYRNDEDNKSALNTFLDANTVDVSQYFTNFSFEQKTGKGVAPGWTSSTGSDRWGTNGPDEATNLLSNYICDEIQTAYNLAPSVYSQTVDLPRGKYLYVVQGKANVYFKGRDGTRTFDMYTGVDSLSFFVNADTVRMDGVPTWRAKTYMLVSDQAADGNKTIGFSHRGTAAYGKQGGNLCFDNVSIRLVGQTQADVDRYFYGSKLAGARGELKHMLDSATAASGSAAYIFGKDVLADSISTAQAVYDGVVDPTEENCNTVTGKTAWLGRAIAAYYKINAEYKQLGDDIAACKENIGDETRPSGKDVFQNAIGTAESYYTSITAGSRDSLAMVRADSTLMAARTAWYIANASYSTPADIYLVNNSFQMGNTSGWTVDTSGGNAVWGISESDAYAVGHAITYSRGAGAEDVKYAYQDVRLEANGVYAFTAECRVRHADWGDDPQSSLTYLFIGTDSLELFTPASDEWQNFSVRTVVSAVTALEPANTIRVGFTKPTANRVNRLGFGAAHLLYYGPYDKYLADSIAAVIQPTRDSLQQAIDEAKAVEYRNPNKVDISAYTNAIATAQGVHDDAGATIDELNAQFQLLVKAVQDLKLSGVWPAEGEYFDLTFVLKNADFSDAENMLAGWYMEGDSIDGLPATGYVTKQFQADDTFYSRMTQTVTGLPEGKYQFVAGASYRCNGQPSTFNPADYETNTFVYLIANEDSVPVKGLLAEGEDGGVDANGDKQWNLGDMMLPMWDFRRTPNVALFEANHYRSAVEFELSGTDKATVGISSQGLTKNSWFGFYMPRIHFWGDVVADGIDNVTEDAGVSGGVSGDVYTLSGVKVRSNATSLDGLAKGIYIMNGKKYVVR